MSKATNPEAPDIDLAMAARVVSLSRILEIRERELLTLKGPCSNKRCGLHYAHAGPCDEAPKKEEESE